MYGSPYQFHSYYERFAMSDNEFYASPDYQSELKGLDPFNETQDEIEITDDDDDY
jgi:hypothetical protein